MSGEQLHTFLDNIEKHMVYIPPPALGLAAAIACCGFTFLLGAVRLRCSVHLSGQELEIISAAN